MTPTSDTGIADEVRAHMARKRMTNEDLGALLKLSRPTVTTRLSGNSAFSVKELRTLADWFDVTVASLIGEQNGNAA